MNAVPFLVNEFVWRLSQSRTAVSVSVSVTAEVRFDALFAFLRVARASLVLIRLMMTLSRGIIAMALLCTLAVARDEEEKCEKVEKTAQDWYDSDDAFNFYQHTWGGEVHIGLFDEVPLGTVKLTLHPPH